MEFLQYIAEGGALWNAWVAAHWERRLRRQDYRDADVRRTASFIVERLASFPLHCLGHLLLGMCRILLRKAELLDDAVEELRRKLLTSSGRGAGAANLPGVRRVVLSDVTLSHVVGEDVYMDPNAPGLDDLDALGNIGAGLQIPGLELLLEPEVPPVEADLEEGRRHVATWESITLSASLPIPLQIDGPSEAFGEATQAEQDIMDALRRLAGTPQLDLGPIGPLVDPDSALPPIDMLLNDGSVNAGTDIFGGHSGSFGQRVDETPTADETPATPSQNVPPTTLPFDTPLDLPSNLRPGSLAGLLGFSPAQASDVGIDLPADIIPIGPIDFGLDQEGQQNPDQGLPENPDEGPRRKRPRRQKPWYDEQTTVEIKDYHNTASITLEPMTEYGLYVPHRRPNLPYTTVMSNMCPWLCGPMVWAPRISERIFKASVEAARAAEAARDAEAARIAEAAAAAGAAATEAAATAAAEAAAEALGADAMDVDVVTSSELRIDVGEPASATPERDPHSQDETGWHLPDWNGDDGRSPGEAPFVRPDDQTADGEHVASSPDRHSPATERDDSPLPLPGDDVRPDSPQHSPGAAAAAAAAGLAGQDAVSFFQLCEAGGGSAEAAARQLVGLLSKHMDGVVCMEQAEAYADILIRRGPEYTDGLSSGAG